MQTESSKRALRNTVRMSVFLLPLLGMGALNAQTVDLVAHNGFEACWSQAIAEQQFLTLMQTSLNGATVCVGPQSVTQNGVTVEICNSGTCGGQPGCKIATHAAAFSGDFGTGTFAGTGSADDLIVPVTFSGAINDTCSITISNIALSFAPDYDFIADGNNGDYSAALIQAPLLLTSDTLTGSDGLCTAAIAAYGDNLKSAAEAAGTSVVESRLRTNTLGESICPLTP